MLKIKVTSTTWSFADLIMPGLRGDDFYLKAKNGAPGFIRSILFITASRLIQRFTRFYTRHEVKYLTNPSPLKG